MTVAAPLTTPAARRARARILEFVRAGTADPDFLCELSRRLRLIVPFAASFWSASDPLTTLAISPARVDNLAGQCERFWEREFLIPDVNLYRDLALAERPVASLYRATDRLPARSIRYREVHRELGYGDELRGMFRTGGAAWGMVSLWRDADQPPFSPAEEQLVADLSAPIAESFRRAALLRAVASDEAPEAPGLLVFDGQGALESFNEQAARWLSQLPAPTAADREVATRSNYNVPIPTEIRAEMGFAHAIAAGAERGVARVNVRGCNGCWLVIHCFPLRGPRDAQPRTALVIQPAKASEIAPIIVEAYDLSPREQQITQLLARGLSTALIARQLCLSPHTVRDYVKCVLAKVGVSTRGELVARLFGEYYSAPLHDSKAQEPPGDGYGPNLRIREAPVSPPGREAPAVAGRPTPPHRRH